jgi:hypothetical protein
MANTLTKIASFTVTSATANSVTFSSIPSTYTDLKLVFSGRAQSAAVFSSFGLQFNGDGGTNYSQTLLQSLGSGVASYRATSGSSLGMITNGANNTSGVFSSNEVYIPNYTSSTNKSVIYEDVLETNANNAYIDLWAGLWRNSAAINQIYLFGTTFVQYSSFTLYGIKNIA